MGDGKETTTTKKNKTTNPTWITFNPFHVRDLASMLLFFLMSVCLFSPTNAGISSTTKLPKICILLMEKNNISEQQAEFGSFEKAKTTISHLFI